MCRYCRRGDNFHAASLCFLLCLFLGEEAPRLFSVVYCLSNMQGYSRGRVMHATLDRVLPESFWMVVQYVYVDTCKLKQERKGSFYSIESYRVKLYWFVTRMLPSNLVIMHICDTWPTSSALHSSRRYVVDAVILIHFAAVTQCINLCMCVYVLHDTCTIAVNAWILVPLCESVNILLNISRGHMHQCPCYPHDIHNIHPLCHSGTHSSSESCSSLVLLAMAFHEPYRTAPLTVAKPGSSGITSCSAGNVSTSSCCRILHLAKPPTRKRASTLCLTCRSPISWIVLEIVGSNHIRHMSGDTRRRLDLGLKYTWGLLCLTRQFNILSVIFA